ncbi:MAG: hypothetical protein KJO34_19750 [Deltaproteobacteria bacterium]|nr:hypothetical protein [Deltaproteobacteria bacterium]
MIKFYTNKQLSQKFNLNIAKWKRWSREFLPPDPLGGLQSGFARQYNQNQAFTVFLGGHLVSDLKFTIPETKDILNDLNQWLLDYDFYFNFSSARKPGETSVPRAKSYQIAIIRNDISDASVGAFSYVARGALEDESTDFQGVRVCQERFVISSIGPGKSEIALVFAESHRVLGITALHKNFIARLQGAETG